MKSESASAPIETVSGGSASFPLTSRRMDFSSSAYSSNSSSLTSSASCSPVNIITSPNIDDRSEDHLTPLHFQPEEQQHKLHSPVSPKFQKNLGDYHQNLVQFQQDMSQLQQDIAQVRLSSAEGGGDTSLQNVYLERLQELVPWVPNDEELPKLQVVQAVIDYINMLQDQLAAETSAKGGSEEKINHDDFDDCYFKDSGASIDDCSSDNNENGSCELLDVGDSPSSSSCLLPSPPPPVASLPPSTAPPAVHSAHLFSHQNQMVNELRHLQMVQNNSHDESYPQPSDLLSSQTLQQLSSEDVRHIKLKDQSSQAQHMAGSCCNRGGGGSSMGEDMPPMVSNMITSFSESSYNAALSANFVSNNNSPYNNSLLPSYYTPNQDSIYVSNKNMSDASYSQATPSIFPFPAPPSPQTIKAARKKKFQYKRQQEILQQQLLTQDQIANSSLLFSAIGSTWASLNAYNFNVPY